MLPSPPAAADLARTAGLIAAARRPLVTGLVNAPAAVAVAACDLAEAVGAAVDPGSPETARLVGPLVARPGLVSAAPDELRDRADLVIFWFVAARSVTPEWCDRFVTPSLPHSAHAPERRRTLAVGPDDVPSAGSAHRALAVARAAAVDLARLVEAIVRGVAIDEAAADPATLATAREIAAACAAAGTIAVVSDWRGDSIGLAAWSTAALVRALAHGKPAFEIPLGERDDDAVAVTTWRYGAAGAIDRADRTGGRFLPAEADAPRLIDRGEIDGVIVVGEAPPEVEAALARAGDGLAVLRVKADADTLRRLVALVAAARGAPA